VQSDQPEQVVQLVQPVAQDQLVLREQQAVRDHLVVLQILEQLE